MYPANIAYEPSYGYKKDLRWFYKGLTVVEEDGEFAVLNEAMEYVIPRHTYQWISAMNPSGLMIVKLNNQYGLLNHELRLLQPTTFDTISNAPPKRYSNEQDFPTFWAKKNEKYYIFDTLGNWIDSISYDKVTVLQSNYYLVTKDTASWRLDGYGKKVIEDFTVVRDDWDYFIAKKDSQFGVVDLSGEVIVPFKYEEVICEPLGNILVKKDGKWGVVSEMNTLILPCEYDYVAYAFDGSSNGQERNYIVVQNDKFGKIGTTIFTDSLDQETVVVKEIFPCIYDGITTWVEYGPPGHYVMLGDKMGLIDYEGSVLVPVIYEKVNYVLETDWAFIYDKGKAGLYNIKTNVFELLLTYDYIFVDNDWLKFIKDKPTRIITYNNGIINILDEHGKRIKKNVSNAYVKKEFNVDIYSYQFTKCSYSLTLMVHNRTYTIPDCMLEIFKENNRSIETLFYDKQRD
jgi:hypothetical protein